MSTADAWENGQLNLVLLNSNFAGLGDATGLRGSSTAGSIYMSLHTADPGEAGNQGTSEISYTGYARVGVPRNGTNWSVSSGVGTNLLDQLFGACTAGSGTATHIGLGTDPTGAGILMFSGALTTPRAISAGIQPRVAASALTITIT